MTIITTANAKEMYKEYLPTLDTTAEVLTTEEKVELTKDFNNIEEEADLYMVALDWNVTIAVVKQIAKEF